MQEIEKKWQGNLIKDHGACKNFGSLPATHVNNYRNTRVGQPETDSN